jgi:hypothetical protein
MMGNEMKGVASSSAKSPAIQRLDAVTESQNEAGNLGE